MNNAKIIRADDVMTGRAKDVSRYREGRICRLCGCKLGTYTPGPCCLADSPEWTWMQIKKREEADDRKKAKYERDRKTKERKKREYIQRRAKLTQNEGGSHDQHNEIEGAGTIVLDR